MAENCYDVIYIDDDPMMAELFNQFVTWKYTTWRAQAYTDSLALYQQILAGELCARVWIVDIMMPEKNGAEIASAIQAVYGSEQVVFGYTALEAHSLEHDPAYQAGLQYFSQIVRKNEGIPRVLALVETILRERMSSENS